MSKDVESIQHSKNIDCAVSKSVDGVGEVGESMTMRVTATDSLLASATC